MSNAQSFEAFKDASNNAIFYYPRPYGIYWKGEVFWNKKLPRRQGSVVRIAEDDSGCCLSLMVWDIDGRYLCSAWPISWVERDHPFLRELDSED